MENLNFKVSRCVQQSIKISNNNVDRQEEELMKLGKQTLLAHGGSLEAQDGVLRRDLHHVGVGHGVEAQ